MGQTIVQWILTFILAWMLAASLLMGCAPQSPLAGDNTTTSPCDGFYAGRTTSDANVVTPVSGHLQGDAFGWLVGTQEFVFAVDAAGEITDDQGNAIGSIDMESCSGGGSVLLGGQAAAVNLSRVPCVPGQSDPEQGRTADFPGTWTLIEPNTGVQLATLEFDANGNLASMDYSAADLGALGTFGTFLFDEVTHDLDDGSGQYTGLAVAYLDASFDVCIGLRIETTIEGTTRTVDWLFSGSMTDDISPILIYTIWNETVTENNVSQSALLFAIDWTQPSSNPAG